MGVFSTTKIAKGRISHAPEMVLGTGDQFGERCCDGQLLPGRAEQKGSCHRSLLHKAVLPERSFHT